MLEGLSPLHLILILGIVLIVVGPRRLPEMGSALGKTLREFREATTGLTDALPTAASPAAPALPAAASTAVPAATPAVQTVAPPAVDSDPAA